MAPQREWLCDITSAALDGRAISDVQECRSLCAACMPEEWLWVDSNGTSGKPTFRRREQPVVTFQDLQSFRRYRGLKSEVVDDVHAKADLFEKDPLPSNFPKCFLKWFTISQIHALCANFVNFGWREIGKVVRYLRDKKNKTSARSPALGSPRIAPKISLGLLQTIYSESPKFHPNPFTSGRVIAERVNIVETRHKVFPILQLLRRVNIHTNAITVLMLIQMYIVVNTTRMWANAQPDGRPAEHRWRPLFNAAKFGWRPLLDAVQ